MSYKGSASEGARAEQLLRAREREREDSELRKSRIEQESERLATAISAKFSATTEVARF
jgi:hypothetical protein